MDLRKSAGGKTLPACFECHGKVLCCNRFRKIGGRGTDLAACSPCGELGVCVVWDECVGCVGSGDFAGARPPGVWDRSEGTSSIRARSFGEVRRQPWAACPRHYGACVEWRTGIAGRFGVMRKVPKRTASLAESWNQRWKTWQSVTEKMSGFCRLTSDSFSMGFDGGTKFSGIFPGEKSWYGWT